MRSYHKIIRQLIWRLPAAKRAQYLLDQIDARGELRDVDVDRLAAYVPQDDSDRSAYLRVLWQWSRAHNDVLGLIEEDIMSDVGKEMLVRFHIIDRHMAWERPKIEALESYVEPGGWTNWRQHPWAPSGVLPVPADPEAAWLDFVEWCQEGPYHSAKPLLRRETYLKIFSENKPYHTWELRQASAAEPTEGERGQVLGDKE
jgi:hypothetical protein